MPILRDLFCTVCATEVHDVSMPSDERRMVAMCATCDAMRTLEIVCNGGMGARYRINDWPTDPEFYRGQVKALDVTAKDSNDVPIQKYDSTTKQLGEVMHNNPRYKNGSDRREIRRDQIMHDSRRTRGRLPILFDMRGKRVSQ